jgi:glycosyltransferase involved in cell wall biosynthesis
MHTDLFTFHHTIERFFTEEQEKDAYNKMDKIVFVSNDSKKQFGRLYPDIKTHKEVIWNPIEKDLIIQYRKEYKKYSVDRCFNIVSVGRLSSKEKAFDRLVRLAKRLKDDNYNFNINIIGEGEHRQELERLIVENKVENKVSLLGFINPPYEIMSNADLFILPSIVEGFALVVGEAFCLGLPIVSTKTTGPVELIDNDKYGILTDHDDESIYQAVKKMIDDDNLREHYHKKSLERVEILDVDAVMKQIYNIL